MLKEKFGMKSLSIRKMSFHDLQGVYDIEKLSNPTPWSKTSFSDCLRGFYQNLIVTLDKEQVAFCIMTINFTESHLLNISVHPNYRHQGIGEILLKVSEKKAIKKGVTDIFLEVRESNKNAISFYKKNKYKYVGIRKNYYKLNSGREDGLIFTKHLEISKLNSFINQMTYMIMSIFKIKN
tara:strand:- start:52 stop:591 length:540 start_codon:yes stop_codon:yes gene_type:complete